MQGGRIPMEDSASREEVCQHGYMVRISVRQSVRLAPRTLQAMCRIFGAKH